LPVFFNPEPPLVYCLHPCLKSILSEALEDLKAVRCGKN
jgi:hypothetical protein